MNLKQLRKSKKLTQNDLAEIAGVCLPTVIMWEDGRMRPDEYSAQLLADYFNCYISHIKIIAPKR